jgi:hypothetical protein
MHVTFRSRRSWVGLAVGVAAASGIGAAVASIPDGSGVIHGCYSDKATCG